MLNDPYGYAERVRVKGKEKVQLLTDEQIEYYKGIGLIVVQGSDASELYSKDARIMTQEYYDMLVAMDSVVGKVYLNWLVRCKR